MTPSPPAPPAPPGRPRSTRWQRRFGDYFIGVAIGCILVGMLLYARWRGVQVQPGAGGGANHPVAPADP